MFQKIILLLLLLFVACNKTNSEPVLSDPLPAMAAITAHVFGAEISPDLVVATVENHEIVASDVAAMAMLFPTLTVEQIINDLIDAHIAASHADPEASGLVAAARIDGDRRGLMTAWMWENVWSKGSFEVSEEEITAFLADSVNAPLFGHPQLARTSQILIQLGEAEVREEAEQIGADLVRILTEIKAENGFLTSQDLAAAIDSQTPSDGISLRLKEHLTFPRRYSGPATWENGIEAVVEPYAAAAFDNPPASLVGPVMSNFGFHVILVEDHIPATFERDEQTIEIARRGVIAARFREHFTEQANLVFQQIPYEINPEASRMLSSTGLERVSASREERAQQVQAQ